jgi:beta-phosphoglucomutase-like phosphatase (HAD superfamily)
MKAVLFDVEGTLIDCAQQTIAAWQQTLHSFGYEVSKAEIQQRSGRDTAEMLELLLPDTSKAQRDELAKKESELYQKKYLPSVRPFAGVPPCFRRPNRLASRSVWPRPASRSNCARTAISWRSMI